MTSTLSHDERSGSKKYPFGFVYFDDDHRIAYASGVPLSIGATGGWQPLTVGHLIEARNYLAKVFPEIEWTT